MAKSNDHSAFDALYRESRDDVYAYVAYLVGDRHVAEDVTAQAIERAYRKHDRFNPRRGTRRAWLFGIARNAALDELRRSKRVAVLDLEVEHPDPSASDPVESALTRADLVAALRQLDRGDRELIAIKYFGGLANSEIARALGISESNVGTRLHRGLNRLREILDENL